MFAPNDFYVLCLWFRAALSAFSKEKLEFNNIPFIEDSEFTHWGFYFRVMNKDVLAMF